MMEPRIVEVTFDVDITIEDRGHYKVATVSPFGIVADAEDIPTVLRVVEQGTYHLLDEYYARGDIWDFLAGLGITYHIQTEGMHETLRDEPLSGRFVVPEGEAMSFRRAVAVPGALQYA
ncbi:MAG: hypothetical protein F4X94_05985 [Dehalococcoidia bacterium]|nr:hypothetical protein [Dehalococcoidia bacterium]